MTAFWNSYGFYCWLITTILLLILSGALASLWRRLKTTTAHYEALIAGVSGGTLEDLLHQRSVQVQQHEETLSSLTQRVQTLEHSSITQVGVVRFNPFDEVGSDQSFSVALLDGELNGFVLSSIHTRQGTRVYAKSIRNGRSPHQLSDEEEQAISRACGTLSTSYTPTSAALPIKED